jgi:hypothetical protein
VFNAVSRSKSDLSFAFAARRAAAVGGRRRNRPSAAGISRRLHLSQTVQVNVQRAGMARANSQSKL